MEPLAGHIEGRWSDEKVMIRLGDGRVLELPAPKELRGIFDVGDEVRVYFEDDGRVAGWALSERRLGVNLRGMDSEDG